MADQRVVEYLRENLAKGYPVQQLRRNLEAEGYAQREIEEAFSMAMGVPVAPPPPKPPKPRKKTSKKLIVLLIIMLILLAMFLMAGVNTVNSFKDMFPETLLPFKF